MQRSEFRYRRSTKKLAQMTKVRPFWGPKSGRGLLKKGRGSIVWSGLSAPPTDTPPWLPGVSPGGSLLMSHPRSLWCPKSGRILPKKGRGREGRRGKVPHPLTRPPGVLGVQKESIWSSKNGRFSLISAGLFRSLMWAWPPKKGVTREDRPCHAPLWSWGVGLMPHLVY